MTGDTTIRDWILNNITSGDLMALCEKRDCLPTDMVGELANQLPTDRPKGGDRP